MHLFVHFHIYLFIRLSCKSFVMQMLFLSSDCCCCFLFFLGQFLDTGCIYIIMKKQRLCYFYFEVLWLSLWLEIKKKATSTELGVPAHWSVVGPCPKVTALESKIPVRYSGTISGSKILRCGGWGFFLACEYFGRMFDNSFPACDSFFFFFFLLSGD